ELRDGLLPGLLVTRLAGLVDLGEPHDAFLVDQEGATDRETGLLVEHAVGLRDLTVRPEVRQQRKLVALLLGPRLQRERRVHRDAEHLDALVVVVRELVPQLAELSLADAAERERVEHQQHRLVPTERRQGDFLLVVVVQREVRGFGTDLDRHTELPLARARPARRTPAGPRVPVHPSAGGRACGEPAGDLIDVTSTSGPVGWPSSRRRPTDWRSATGRPSAPPRRSHWVRRVPAAPSSG